jgi:hypothetical protein
MTKGITGYKKVPLSLVRKPSTPGGNVRFNLDPDEYQLLRASMKVHGLLEPIVIQHDGTLVAGRRRLACAYDLGWTEIDAVYLEDLTEEQRRVLQLEENLRREPLKRDELRSVIDDAKAYHRKLLVEAGEISYGANAPKTATGNQQKEGDTASNKKRGRPKQSAKNPGRPKKGGSQRDVGEMLGRDHATIQRAEAERAAIERYPFMAPWPQTYTLRASKALDVMEDAQRTEALAAIADMGAEEACMLLESLSREEGDTGPATTEAADEATAETDVETAQEIAGFTAQAPTWATATSKGKKKTEPTKGKRDRSTAIPASDPLLAELRKLLFHAVGLAPKIQARLLSAAPGTEIVESIRRAIASIEALSGGGRP